MTDLRFWWWRVCVSYYGWKYLRRIAAWGFQDEQMDRDAFESGETPECYFIEAWGRE